MELEYKTENDVILTAKLIKQATWISVACRVECIKHWKEKTGNEHHGIECFDVSHLEINKKQANELRKGWSEDKEHPPVCWLRRYEDGRIEVNIG